MQSLKSLYLSFLTRKKYGTTRPDAVVPPGSPSPVHINPADRRALKKLAFDSARGRLSVPLRFWRDAFVTIDPRLGIDVGANYGECFSSRTYAPGVRVLALEANPALIPYLEKTRNNHPSAEQIEVVNCLVSELPSSGQTFYYNPDWTGGGSALAPDKTDGYRQAVVPARSMDHLLGELGLAEVPSLVFKVDIEGYEGMFLRGFSRLLSIPRVAGILEFDTAMLARAGTPAEEVFEFLSKRFEVYDTLRHHATLCRMPDWASLVAARSLRGEPFHTDLVVLTSGAELPAGWTVVSRT